uniref:Density-regulated protein n=1 Tax=Neogobius melanostomus TaxID=47308 RepID=A0A8C6TQE3_9GOBI
MATTEMDGPWPSDSDLKDPLKVLYCGVYSRSLEYYEYMPEPAKCRQWLEKNFPDVFAGMTVGSAANALKQEPGTGDVPPIKHKKKTIPQKVTIARIPRATKKFVTRVCGLGTFDIDLQFQQFFAQTFSCGASVTAEDEIITQVDFTDEIIEGVILEPKQPENAVTRMNVSKIPQRLVLFKR